MRPDFWLSCGHHLVDRDEAGGLPVSDALLAAWLARPELVPPEEACGAERALHASLLANPRRGVAGIEVAGLADADARENWQAWLGFRDHLLAHPTLEAAYVALFRGEAHRISPLFIAQLAQLILRNILDPVDDPLRVRAAELFFRTQRVSTEGGNLLLADEETVESAAGNARQGNGGLGVLGQMIAETGAALRSVELDVLSPENAGLYWERSDRFDTVLDLTFGREGQDALARVIEAWVRHLLGIAVSVQPLQTIHDEAWAWYVGLDAEATAISTRLWNGEKVAPEALGRVMALFRLEFENPAEMLPRVAGKPVYLSLAMTEGKTLRMKPQNLLAGLPLRQARAA
jgi:hypothetical protein